MLRKIYVVYCHTNKINGKKYIGITNDVKRRWGSNGLHYKPDKNSNQNVAFWNAIKKYGWNNFTHEILEDGLSFEEACEREHFYICKYQTFIGFFKDKTDRKGYNSTLGGEGTVGLCGELHHLYGTKLTEEQKKKISDANSRKIIGYSLDGELLKIFNSEREAVDYINTDSKSVWAVLNGQRLQVKGFILRYDGEPFEKYRTKKKNLTGENHPMYGRKHSAESKKKMSINSIGKNCGSENHMSKKVTIDGIEFETIKQLCSYIGEKYTTVQCWLNGRNKIPQKYIERGLCFV